MVATTTVAAAALHCPLLCGKAVWDSNALCECGSGIQRLHVPDRDQGAVKPRELHGPTTGGEPHHCVSKQHQPTDAAHPHL